LGQISNQPGDKEADPGVSVLGGTQVNCASFKKKRNEVSRTAVERIN